jgi:pyroglutamyl-peptidase
MIKRNLLSEHCYFLRKVIVDFDLAPQQVISAMVQLEPDITICCGMAEGRTALSIESNGKFRDEQLATQLNLEQLLEGTIATQISHDAGNFVCNHLYYSVLKHIQITQLNHHCLFLHIPMLNEKNIDAIVQDFLTIVERINIRNSI